MKILDSNRYSAYQSSLSFQEIDNENKKNFLTEYDYGTFDEIIVIC